MRKDQQRRIAQEILIFLALMASLFFVLRLWPVVFLFILGIFTAALRMLYLSTKQVEIIEPDEPADIPAPRPQTEQDFICQAFDILTIRITEDLERQYPGARWVWGSTNARAKFTSGGPLFIRLNRAGGYCEASVQIDNLQFRGLNYVTVTDQQSTSETDQENEYTNSVTEDTSGMTAEAADKPDALQINYDLMAFEWIQENLVDLNKQCNEAIARHKTDHLTIPESDLPEKGSWHTVCEQLMKNGFTFAVEEKDGIKVNLPQ